MSKSEHISEPSARLPRPPVFRCVIGSAQPGFSATYLRRIAKLWYFRAGSNFHVKHVENQGILALRPYRAWVLARKACRSVSLLVVLCRSCVVGCRCVSFLVVEQKW